MWDCKEIFDVIFDKYIHYVHNLYSHNIVILFDIYTDYKKYIKDAEQRRRATEISSLLMLFSIDLGLFQRTNNISLLILITRHGLFQCYVKH